MRKVVLYALTSLDGAVDDPGRYFPATHPTVRGAPVFDPVMIEMEAQLIRDQDAVLLGRKMFDEWSGYCPRPTSSHSLTSSTVSRSTSSRRRR